MRSLLQRVYGYRHDSKDNNHFICNLLLYKLQMLLYLFVDMHNSSEYLYKYSEGGGEGGAKPPQ